MIIDYIILATYLLYTYTIMHAVLMLIFSSLPAGHLVSDFLITNKSPMEYCKEVDGQQQLNGFSLLTADLKYANNYYDCFKVK